MAKGDKEGVTAVMEAGALKAALGSVIGAVESGNTIPVLANVALRFSPGKLAMTATNLDQQIDRQVPCEVPSSWATTVCAKLLKAIADKLPGGAEVSLTRLAGSGKLTIRCGRAVFDVMTLPIEDFPDMGFGDVGDGGEFEMAGAELAAMLAHTKHAISTEETRYYLNGVFVERREAELFMVATDGHRLAIARRPAPDGSDVLGLDGSLSRGAIVPRQFVAMIEPLCKESRVDIAIKPGRIMVEAGEVRMISKLVDGSFPDWRRVVPAANDKIVGFDPAVLSQAIERVRTIATDKTRAVKLSFDRDRVQCMVVSPDNGTAMEEVSISYDGPPLDIGCNSGFLLTALARLPGEHAELHCLDATAPILITASADAADRCVVMPMRV